MSDDPSFEAFRKQRDQMHSAVNKWHLLGFDTEMTEIINSGEVVEKLALRALALRESGMAYKDIGIMLMFRPPRIAQKVMSVVRWGKLLKARRD